MNAVAIRDSSPVASPVGIEERRNHTREPVLGDVWLIDAEDESFVHCRCVDSSAGGMGLRAPIGYGIRPGRTFELCASLLPTMRRGAEAVGMVVSRRIRVVRTVARADDQLEVGVVFQAPRASHTACRLA